jgi:hypothetical protein
MVMALLVALLSSVATQPKPDQMPCVAVSKDKKGFVLEPSGRPFVPWGFNYDHDDKGRLIEDYWEDEWPTVEVHFAQMRNLQSGPDDGMVINDQDANLRHGSPP